MQNPTDEFKILIVGGGTAGWLTAGLLAAEYGRDSGVNITVVESPDVKTIGVGEGTWPTFRTTLRQLGLSETEFLRQCSASFKQGTKFAGWCTGAPDDIYYHPFSVPAGYPDPAILAHWVASDVGRFDDAVTVQSGLCDLNLAPKQMQTPEYAGVTNYGYHLDAGKFAAWLRDHAVGNLGVGHLVDHVDKVNGEPGQPIGSLQTRQHGALSADLFVDCTGFASLLLGEHLRVPFIGCGDVLPNDTALATHVTYDTADEPIASQTNSTAQEAGWIWDIGLSSRRGVGYVYASDHIDESRARDQLMTYIKGTGGTAGDVRKISFKAGHRQVFWKHNCVAVGLSAGFLEPLEASALVLVELSARMIRDELNTHRTGMALAARRYNEQFGYRWNRIIDFLKLHYVLSQREEPYWHAARDPSTIPESLTESMQAWRYRVPGLADFPRVDEVFSAASFLFVLYGMGFGTELRATNSLRDAAQAAERLSYELRQKHTQLARHLPGTRQLLQQIAEQSFPPADLSSVRQY